MTLGFVQCPRRGRIPCSTIRHSNGTEAESLPTNLPLKEARNEAHGRPLRRPALGNDNGAKRNRASEARP